MFDHSVMNGVYALYLNETRDQRTPGVSWCMLSEVLWVSAFTKLSPCFAAAGAFADVISSKVYQTTLCSVFDDARIFNDYSALNGDRGTDRAHSIR